MRNFHFAFGRNCGGHFRNQRRLVALAAARLWREEWRIGFKQDAAQWRCAHQLPQGVCFGVGHGCCHANAEAEFKQRIQVFKGVVLRRSGGGVRETFTVRKESYGVGVERTFPLHSPNIDHIEVLTRGAVRRAKLYYLRDLRGKKAKIKEKR